MSYWGTCFTRGHILQDDLLYRGTPYMRTSLNWRVFRIGSHVLHESMSYRWTWSICDVSGHVLLKHMK